MSSVETSNKNTPLGKKGFRFINERRADAAEAERKRIAESDLAKRADEFEVQESARRRLTGAAGVTDSESEANQLGRPRSGAKRRSASRTLLG